MGEILVDEKGKEGRGGKSIKPYKYDSTWKVRLEFM